MRHFLAKFCPSFNSLSARRLFVLALLFAFLGSSSPLLALSQTSMIRVSPLKAGQSRWVVCSGNPVNCVDPDGLDWEMVVQMRRANGETQIPATRVKWKGQEKNMRRKVGQKAPIFAPPLSESPQRGIRNSTDLQGFVDQFEDPANFRNWSGFAAFWVPGGNHDYKLVNNKYDPFGNFMFGATGRAAGFSREELMTAADDILKLGKNAEQNNIDIEAGMNWYESGAKFEIVEYWWP